MRRTSPTPASRSCSSTSPATRRARGWPARASSSRIHSSLPTVPRSSAPAASRKTWRLSPRPTGSSKRSSNGSTSNRRSSKKSTATARRTPSSAPIHRAFRSRRSSPAGRRPSGRTPSGRTSSIRRATCGWSRSSVPPIPTRRSKRPWSSSAITASARAWSPPRTRQTSSPTGSASTASCRSSGRGRDPLTVHPVHRTRGSQFRRSTPSPVRPSAVRRARRFGRWISQASTCWPTSSRTWPAASPRMTAASSRCLRS